MVHFLQDLRHDQSMYFLRALQWLFAIIILGIAGDDVASWHSSDCNSPARSSFNLAVAVLVLPGLTYLLFALTARFTKLPWSAWAQLAFDFVFLVFWLADGAAWAPDLSCGTLCGLCAQLGYDNNYTYGGYYYFGDSCQCYDGNVVFDLSNRRLAKRAGSSAGDAAAAKALSKISKKAAKLGLNWVMFILFLISFGATTYAIVQHRKATRGEAPVAAAHVEPKKSEVTVTHMDVADESV